MKNNNNIGTSLSKFSSKNPTTTTPQQVWLRSVEDDRWSVVGYSDGSRFLFEDGLAVRLTLLGEIDDGLGMSEVLETSNGAIIALYCSGPQIFADREAWLDSMPESDKPAARHLLGS